MHLVDDARTTARGITSNKHGFLGCSFRQMGNYLMGQAMACTNNSTEYEMIRDAEAWVHEVYTDFKNRGWDADVALEQTALDLGLTRRRVRSFKSGWASALAVEEWRELKRRFMAHLDAEAEYAMKRHDKAAARLESMRREAAELKRMRA